MADEDKEKAEKLAAAKKRFEQLKKEQKKGKKGKKKEEKPAETKAEGETEDAPADDTADVPENADIEPAAEAENDETNDVEPSDTAQPSPSLQSKQRSESFRQGTDGPQAEVQDLYRKQAAKIEQLEKENKTLKEEKDQEATRLSKAEEELESLREGSSDLAELKTKAKEADRLSTELASVQRQLSQAQQSAPPTHVRRASGINSGTDLDAQLASKTTTIETLELEISNLRHQLTTLESTLSEKDLALSDQTSLATVAETAQKSLQSELDALKVSLSFPPSSSPDPAALTARITILESDLRTANTNLTAAADRAAQLEAKIEALTKLHREATSSKDREISELRAASGRPKPVHRGSHVHDVSEFELGEDDGEDEETKGLHARIRALEAENFELKRGVWRERRAELQPGMSGGEFGQDGNNGGNGFDYEDVDLGGSNSPRAYQSRGGGGGVLGGRQTSTFSDVITSGINAFTGRERGASRSNHNHAGHQHERKQSLGLLSDDGFDEEAFRLAQEEEAKRRIERVKEVKRGLEQWRGWRVDVADGRQYGIGYGREAGPVFEV